MKQQKLKISSQISTFKGEQGLKNKPTLQYKKKAFRDQVNKPP